MYLQNVFNVFLVVVAAVLVFVLAENEENVTSTEIEPTNSSTTTSFTSPTASLLSTVKNDGQSNHSNIGNSSNRPFKSGFCVLPFFFPLCCNSSEFCKNFSISNLCKMAESMKNIPNEPLHFIGRSTTTLKDESKPDEIESGTKKSKVKFEFGHDILKGNNSNKKKENYFEEEEDEDAGDEKKQQQKYEEKKKKQKDDDDSRGKKGKDRVDDDDGKKEKDEGDGEKEVDEKDEENKVGGKNDWKRSFHDEGFFETSRNMKIENENQNEKYQRWGECFLNRGGPNCLVDVTDALESKEYFVYVGSDKLDFNTSRSLCLSRNMYLAEVSTPFEEDLLKKVMIHKDSETYWLGMTRDFGDGQLFYWDDGQPTNNFVNMALNVNKVVTKKAIFCVVKNVSGKEHLRFECFNKPPDSYPICMYKPGHIIPPALRNIVYK